MKGIVLAGGSGTRLACWVMGAITGCILNMPNSHRQMDWHKHSSSGRNSLVTILCVLSLVIIFFMAQVFPYC